MKIVGQLVCGPGEADRYLEETLKEFKRLCDDVVVCFCNAGEKEEALLRKYQFRYYKDDREWGKQQPNIKTDLLKRIVQLEPDWILVLDADETVPTVNRQILEELSKERKACQLYVVNLIDDKQYYSPPLSFYNVRFYKHTEGMETQFLRKNLHCGNSPPYFYCLPAIETHVPHILLHKGLMFKKDRMSKAGRYAEYDPRAQFKGRRYYDTLESDNIAKRTYDQEEVLARLQNNYNRIHQ